MHPVCQWTTCPRSNEVLPELSWLNLQYKCPYRVYNSDKGTFECTNPNHYSKNIA